jgi:hypothetical protein
VSGRRKSRARTLTGDHGAPVTHLTGRLTTPATKMLLPSYTNGRSGLADRPSLQRNQPSTMIRYFELAQNFAGSVIFTVWPAVSLPS